ncbi:MAG: calcium-binding protein P [Mediterranea sp.]|jgi:hypothetical protein|nr:calcium-binding protein P [Mediterranea sp.]
MKKFVKIVLAPMVACLLTGAIMSSCAGESDCSVAGRAMLWSSVYKLDGATVADGMLDSLTVTTLPADIILLNKAENVTRFGLPLRYTSDTTTWIFHYGAQISDTVVIRHTNTPEFVSMECGYEMKQAIVGISYTRMSLLDSIRITNSGTNTNETKNLELFFR